MAWTKIPCRVSAPDRVIPVAISIVDRGHGGYSRLKLLIRLSQEVASKGGFDKRSRANVSIGEGSDAGRLLIEFSPAGSFAIAQGHAWGPIQILVAAQPGFPKALPLTKCSEFEVIPGRGVALRLPFDGTEAVAVPVKADPAATVPFEHAGRQILLTPQCHALAMKLHRAMGKGFLGYDVLMAAAGVPDVAALRPPVNRLRRAVEPIGLDVVTVRRLGYMMRAVEDQADEGEAANQAGEDPAPIAPAAVPEAAAELVGEG